MYTVPILPVFYRIYLKMPTKPVYSRPRCSFQDGVLPWQVLATLYYKDDIVCARTRAVMTTRIKPSWTGREVYEKPLLRGIVCTVPDQTDRFNYKLTRLTKFGYETTSKEQSLKVDGGDLHESLMYKQMFVNFVYINSHRVFPLSKPARTLYHGQTTMPGSVQ